MKQQLYTPLLSIIFVMFSLLSPPSMAEEAWRSYMNDLSQQNFEGMSNTTSDSSITAKVKGTLLADQSIDSNSLAVRTELGTVYITGFIDNKKQEEQIIEIVKKIDGVKNVDTGLNIK